MAKRGRPPKGGRVLGPSELVVAGVVARRYYLEDRSKVEIADEPGLSRFRVARILNQARSEGWIKIEISLPGHIDDALSLAVQSELEIKRAVVVKRRDHPWLRATRLPGDPSGVPRRARPQAAGAARPLACS